MLGWGSKGEEIGTNSTFEVLILFLTKFCPIKGSRVTQGGDLTYEDKKDI